MRQLLRRTEAPDGRVFLGDPAQISFPVAAGLGGEPLRGLDPVGS